MLINRLELIRNGIALSGVFLCEDQKTSILIWHKNAKIQFKYKTDINDKVKQIQNCSRTEILFKWIKIHLYGILYFQFVLISSSDFKLVGKKYYRLDINFNFFDWSFLMLH